MFRLFSSNSTTTEKTTPTTDSKPTIATTLPSQPSELSTSKSIRSSLQNDHTPAGEPEQHRFPLEDTPTTLASMKFAASSPALSNTTDMTSDIPKKRRLSFRPFVSSNHHEEHKHTLSRIEEHEKKDKASVAFSKRFLSKPLVSKSDKRAKESAVVVKNLILGTQGAAPKVTTATARPQLSKIKSQLLEPKAANKLIAQLRSMPIQTDANGGKLTVSSQPIHAVCLEHTDEEEERLHFAQLEKVDARTFPVMLSTPIDKLTSLFEEMRIVNLVSSPDLGFGQPGDGEGLLAGAVPTAETVLNGIQQITPQLLALGFATGKAILPDHAGVYPPTDRLSILTYWWGLEVLLPPPSLQYLSNVKSITDAVMNFLSALALVNQGVREILPFIRYISQFIDFEFAAIKAQNKGKGVVCAATWIMPAALVPRSWDFPDPPAEGPTEKSDDKGKDTRPTVSDPLPVRDVTPVINPYPMPHPMAASTPNVAVISPSPDTETNDSDLPGRVVTPSPTTPTTVTTPITSVTVTITTPA